MLLDDCKICSGSGMRIIERPDGTRVAQPCPCRDERKSERLIEAARIPERYRHCSLENYEPSHSGRNASLEAALAYARTFVREYPVETAGKGLLFTGSIGTGKTHLAVGVLRNLMLERGARGLFYDGPELFKLIQHSYNRSSDMTEFEILQPVFDAEVLVLDELGAMRPTDWVFDTISLIINSRYSNSKTTIVTTNYPNQPPSKGTFEGPRLVMYEETLGDRIGERVRSRLQEMMYVVSMQGYDYRSTIKRASLA